MPAVELPVYALSYPKAGRTWLRALIGKLLADRLEAPEGRILDTEWLAGAAGAPPIHFDHDGSAMMHGVRWQDLPRDKRRYAGARVVLIGRDVRDNLVSAYFQATRRIHVWTDAMSPFLRDERYGVDKLLAFYRIWSEHRSVPAAFMFVRYEDLHADAAGTLARVLAFIGIEASDRAIASAVEYCRFDNLRRVEAAGRFSDAALVPGNAGDPESFKVRRGKIGGYRDYLSPGDIAFIDAAIAARGCEFTRARPAG
ncbi:MAG TPA: sulfotransferase domain-containing protein [Casimicrobiaceae bacterium]